MVYSNGSRARECTVGGELWQRDVVACIDLLFKALRGNGSNAPSPAGLIPVDGSPMPLGSTAACEPAPIAREVRARWRSIGATSEYRTMRMSTWRQTVPLHRRLRLAPRRHSKSLGVSYRVLYARWDQMLGKATAATIAFQIALASCQHIA